MSRVALTALALTALLAVQGVFCSLDTMERVFLTNSAYAPKCIDGSPAAMYVNRNESSSKFVIWLEGGGICLNLADCEGRANSDLGSSNNYPSQKEATRGMLQNNDQNPDFRYWNKIYVPYCSGDAWVGTALENLNPFPQAGSWKGYFQGHLIVESVLNISLHTFETANATDIILTGCSAGGIGTMSNCDFTAEWASQNVPGATVKCRPEAAWFGLPINTYKNFPGHDPDPRKSAVINWRDNVKPLQSMPIQACIAAVQAGTKKIANCENHTAGPAYCCRSVPEFFEFIQTPIFVVENTADSYQVYTQGGCPSGDSPAAEKYIQYLHDILVDSMNSSVVHGARAAQNGLFAPACLRHCFEWYEATVDIDSVSQSQAFGDWYFGRGTSNMHLNPSTNMTTLQSC